MMRDTAIEERIINAKGRDFSPKPRTSFWASDLGHPCERYLYYTIVSWQERKKPDPSLAFIFEGGRMIEELAIRDFREAGFPVFIPEQNFFSEDLPCGARIVGKIDIRVKIDDKIYTGEIKSISLNDFKKVSDWRDFFTLKSYWLWKYPAQIQIYLYMRAEERGFLYLKSVPQFKPKFIWVELDLEYVETLLQKVERVWTCIQKKTPPPRIENTNICEMCDFLHICLPEITHTELQTAEDKELLKLLKRWEELKELADEFNEIDKKIRDLVKGKEKLMIGDFLVTGKWVERTNWIIPEEVKKRYGKKKITRYWKKEILRIR